MLMNQSPYLNQSIVSNHDNNHISHIDNDKKSNMFKE